ncbi:MAG: FecR family protein [Proteobacteria bacterium]|nr:FecR family protein [Pseudomonadota bacterium]MBU1611345.1 FecR family protein [Pseudomonadota bacterium]
MRLKTMFLTTGSLLLLLTVLAMPCMANDSDPVGYVQTAQGQVEVICPDGEVKAGAFDLPIWAADKVKTGPESTSQIMFIDKTVLALSEKTEVAINDVYTPDKGGTFDMAFLTGTARIITSAVLNENPEKFQASTPLGTIGIRGTELGILADPDHEVVMLYEGGPASYTDIQTAAGGLSAADKSELCTTLAEALTKNEKAYSEVKGGMDFIAKKNIERQVTKIKDYQEQYQCAP